MCGRYGRRADKQKIAAWAQSHNTNVFDGDALELGPSYNIAPTDRQPVVRISHDTGERELAIMRWGLVPFWATDATIAYSTINARAERLTTNACFREAVKYRRCLVPADVFYEWQKIDAKTKQPYAIALKDTGLFAFAGLWERWKDKQAERIIESFTIITTDPNSLMEPFHDRMPVILKPTDYERWLAPAEPSHLPLDLLRPYQDEMMHAWKVSKDLGNVRNNGPELVQPI